MWLLPGVNQALRWLSADFLAPGNAMLNFSAERRC
jgi:hypothetical protein